MADGGKVEGIWLHNYTYCGMTSPYRFWYSRDHKVSKTTIMTRSDFSVMGWTYVAPKELVEWND